MAVVEKSVLVPYSAQQMFTLVDNVADYPQFMPWCGGTGVIPVDENTVHATVHIDYHHIKQSFTRRMCAAFRSASTSNCWMGRSGNWTGTGNSSRFPILPVK